MEIRGLKLEDGSLKADAERWARENAAKEELDKLPDRGQQPPGLPDKVKIGIAVFTYNGQASAYLGKWIHDSSAVLKQHPRVESVDVMVLEGYPITRLRNKACHIASAEGIDFLLMLDDDMRPDCEVQSDPEAKPYFPSVLDFMLAHDGPCIVGAPYCASPPNERCIVMKLEPIADPSAILPAKMKSYSRREAAVAKGFEEVPALPTGVMMIDCRALRALVPPYFQYEFKTGLELELASTEDVYFTRNMAFAGVPNYVAWDSWAGHEKKVVVRKPRVPDVRDIGKGLLDTWKFRFNVKE